MTQTVLVTGACGHIGTRTVGHLVAAGHRVIAVDLQSRKAKKVAAGFGRSVTIVWGDICDPELWTDALVGVDTVIHLAAVIPPTTDRNPNLAVAVNEVATRDLLGHMEASATAKRLIFASSMVIAGAEQSRREPPLRVDEPPQPSDPYGRSKVSCEEMIRQSALQWSILRIAACPPMSLKITDIGSLDAIFQTSANGRIEVVHVQDASRAFANAVICEPAIGKTLFIGGGERCRTHALDFYNRVFSAMGLLPISAEILRPGPPHCFGDWLDTTESEMLLEFQRNSIDTLVADVRTNVGWRWLPMRVVSPISRFVLTRRSPYPPKTRPD